MSLLDTILPEYSSILDAPSYDKLTDGIESEENIREIIQNESTKRYKTLQKVGFDDKNSKVFLIQNPACLVWQCRQKAKIVRRVPPEFLGIVSQLQKTGKDWKDEQSVKTNQRRDWE